MISMASVAPRRSYGKGTVVWGLAPADVLASLRVPKDVESTAARWMQGVVASSSHR